MQHNCKFNYCNELGFLIQSVKYFWRCG